MGREITLTFVKNGCRKLLLVDISVKGLEKTAELVKDLNPQAKTKLQVTDVSSSQDVQNMVAACVETFGRIDFACNNAGLGLGGVKTAEMTSDFFDKLCNVNEKGVYLCEKYEISQMIKQTPLVEAGDNRHVRGSIVNTASLCGTAALPELSAYNASKHAVVVMSRVDARQYAPQLIRVNTVSPGFVMTPMMTSAGLSEEYLSSIKAQSPMGRLTEAVEVAEAVVWLSSGRASGLTGINMQVDAGASLFHVV
ncbi:uncharacterized protein Z520_07749 [Fonsecaea multimorphosa CBS 102226]|uniref:Uncharacterized protein n=1 Tax=Fonsecaea multimorphosa CBS 102226 TaxID=1442371 RepID=A0A0D2KIP3_9EURO|nr:uncharacterized protein Z520_07749 [Fonsecaea multimorphosa CBS 102226]KIX96483.1 hypothetical protein Z520_07749 [Fonsecaea multimorphosa CBS 102226]OAL28316.1 hypothetical protein AYO22_03022 [Fonsecaea multimorphosa]